MANNIEIIFKEKGLDAIAKKVEDIGKGGGEATPFGKESLKAFANMSETFKKNNPHIVAALSQAAEKGIADGGKKAVSKISQQLRFEAMQDLARHGTSRQMIEKAAAVAMADYRLNNYKGPIPPVIQRPDWRTLLAGGIVGGTNPFMGARFMMDFFRGHGGGGGGGFFGKMFSGAGGEDLAMAAAWKGLRITSEGLRFAFDQLRNAFREGANLFTSAARVGRSPGRQGVFEMGLASIGVSPAIAEQLQLNAEFATRSKRGQGTSTVFSSDEILRSGRGILQRGELQQIQNLGKYLDKFVQESRIAGTVFEQTSKQLFEMRFSLSGLQRDWSAFMRLQAYDLSSLLKPLIEFQSLFVKVKTVMQLASPQHRISQLLIDKIFPGMKGVGEFQQQFGGSGFRNLPTSAFQRIGFSMGPSIGPGLDVAKKTAENTGKTVSILEKLTASFQRMYTPENVQYNMP